MVQMFGENFVELTEIAIVKINIKQQRFVVYKKKFYQLKFENVSKNIQGEIHSNLWDIFLNLYCLVLMYIVIY